MLNTDNWLFSNNSIKSDFLSNLKNKNYSINNNIENTQDGMANNYGYPLVKPTPWQDNTVEYRSHAWHLNQQRIPPPPPTPPPPTPFTNITNFIPQAYATGEWVLSTTPAQPWFIENIQNYANDNIIKPLTTTKEDLNYIWKPFKEAKDAFYQDPNIEAKSKKTVSDLIHKWISEEEVIKHMEMESFMSKSVLPKDRLQRWRDYFASTWDIDHIIRNVKLQNFIVNNNITWDIKNTLEDPAITLSQSLLDMEQYRKKPVLADAHPWEWILEQWAKSVGRAVVDTWLWVVKWASNVLQWWWSLATKAIYSGVNYFKGTNYQAPEAVNPYDYAESLINGKDYDIASLPQKTVLNNMSQMIKWGTDVALAWKYGTLMAVLWMNTASEIPWTQYIMQELSHGIDVGSDFIANQTWLDKETVDNALWAWMNVIMIKGWKFKDSQGVRDAYNQWYNDVWPWTPPPTPPASIPQPTTWLWWLANKTWRVIAWVWRAWIEVGKDIWINTLNTAKIPYDFAKGTVNLWKKGIVLWKWIYDVWKNSWKNVWKIVYDTWKGAVLSGLWSIKDKYNNILSWMSADERKAYSSNPYNKDYFTEMENQKKTPEWLGDVKDFENKKIQWVWDEVQSKIDDLEDTKWETGKVYNDIDNSKNQIDALDMMKKMINTLNKKDVQVVKTEKTYNPEDINKKDPIIKTTNINSWAWIKAEDFKKWPDITFSLTAKEWIKIPWIDNVSIWELNAKMSDFFKEMQEWEWSLIPKRIRNLRQTLWQLRYDKVQTDASNILAWELRKNVDETAKAQIPWLKELDAMYVDKLENFKNWVNDLIYKWWEQKWDFKSNVINILSNVNNTSRVDLLWRMEEYMPWLSKRIQAIHNLSKLNDYSKKGSNIWKQVWWAIWTGLGWHSGSPLAVLLWLWAWVLVDWKITSLRSWAIKWVLAKKTPTQLKNLAEITKKVNDKIELDAKDAKTLEDIKKKIADEEVQIREKQRIKQEEEQKIKQEKRDAEQKIKQEKRDAEQRQKEEEQRQKEEAKKQAHEAVDKEFDTLQSKIEWEESETIKTNLYKQESILTEKKRNIEENKINTSNDELKKAWREEIVLKEKRRITDLEYVRKEELMHIDRKQKYNTTEMESILAKQSKILEDINNNAENYEDNTKNKETLNTLKHQEALLRKKANETYINKEELDLEEIDLTKLSPELKALYENRMQYIRNIRGGIDKNVDPKNDIVWNEKTKQNIELLKIKENKEKQTEAEKKKEEEQKIKQEKRDAEQRQKEEAKKQAHEEVDKEFDTLQSKIEWEESETIKKNLHKQEKILTAKKRNIEKNKINISNNDALKEVQREEIVLKEKRRTTDLKYVRKEESMHWDRKKRYNTTEMESMLAEQSNIFKDIRNNSKNLEDNTKNKETLTELKHQEVLLRKTTKETYINKEELELEEIDLTKLSPELKALYANRMNHIKNIRVGIDKNVDPKNDIVQNEKTKQNIELLKIKENKKKKEEAEKKKEIKKNEHIKVDERIEALKKEMKWETNPEKKENLAKQEKIFNAMNKNIDQNRRNKSNEDKITALRKLIDKKQPTKKKTK